MHNITPFETSENRDLTPPVQQALLPWLGMLSQLHPPTGVLLVGAGGGSSPWVQHLMATGQRNVTLIEADEATAARLKLVAQAQPSWNVLWGLVGRNREHTPFYTASVQPESSLLEPESLRSLWPNLKTAHKQTRQAIALAELQQDTEPPANWLLVDCLPALPILQGAAQQLAAFNVIVLRVLLGSTQDTDHGNGDSNSHTNNNELTQSASAIALHPALQALGFRWLAIETSRHPGIGHALFVRDTAALAQQLQQQLAQQAQTTAEALETATAATAATEAATKQAQERAAQVQQLTEAKASAEKLATESQQQIDHLQNKLTAASTETNEHTDLLRTLLSEVQIIKAQGFAAAESSALEAPWLKSLREIQDATSNGLRNIQNSVQQIIKSVAPENDNIAPILEAQKKTIENLSLKMDPLIAGTPFSDTLQAQLSKQLTATKDAIKEVETRMNTDLSKGLGNAVKQIEAFLRIQSYLGSSDALGDFHGWPISPDIGVFLLERMREQHYDLIIEFGSGTSTALFAKATEAIEQQAVSSKQANDTAVAQVRATEIVTFEHDTLYHGKTMQMLKSRGLDQRVRLVHAPLVDWRDGEKDYLYYDCQRTLMDLGEKYSNRQLRILLLVDGPPGNTCLNARYPAVPFVFSTLGKHQIDVVLDDAGRLEEKQIVGLWKTYWKKRSIHRTDTEVLSEKGIYLSRNCTTEN